MIAGRGNDRDSQVLLGSRQLDDAVVVGVVLT